MARAESAEAGTAEPVIDRVFISHSTRDLGHATRLRDALTRHGVAAETARYIGDRGPTSRATILLVTEGGLSESQVADVSRLRENRRPVIPVLVDGVPPPSPLEKVEGFVLPLARRGPEAFDPLARELAVYLATEALDIPRPAHRGAVARSPTVQQLASELGRPVPATAVIQWLLDRHTEYGGEANTLGARLPAIGRNLGAAEWLELVSDHFDLAPGQELNGRLVIVGLALEIPELGREMLRSGLLRAIEREIRPSLDPLLTPGARGLRAALEPTLLAGYSPDSITGTDLLGMDRDIEALAAVLAARDNQPPLSVGLFGRWGIGKSFFMSRLEACIDALGRADGETFCSHPVQIRFNAWHYVDANLWASLVAHIFERLAAYGADDDEARQRRENLLEKLETSRRVLDEKRRERDSAAEHAAELAKQLEEIEARRRDATRPVGDLGLHELAKAATSDDVRAAADDVAAALGVDVKSDEIAKLVEGGHGLRNYARAGWRALRTSRRRRRRVLSLLVLVAIAAGVVGAVGPAVVAAIGGVVAAVLGVGRAVLQVVAPVGRLLDSVDRARAQRETELRSSLPELEQRVEAEREAYKEAEAELHRAEQELDEATSGHGLRRFIEERAASDKYERHLGVISLVQRDFRELSKLLAPEPGESAEDGPDLPEIDRIVLYIDDLDRCPSRLVVEVLQAVHLLLAFPLFVVVVGVDPSWLDSSLRRHHVAMLASESEQDLADAVGHDGSRPREYLEKIFQIPFKLPPMGPEGYSRLIDGLVPVREPAPEAAREAAAGEPATPQHDVAADLSPEVRAAIDAGDINLPVPRPTVVRSQLVLEPRERDMLQAVGYLIETPRTAKRLVNIYRFIRAAVPPDQLDEFVGDADTPGAFQAVIAMLAILVGRPNDAEAAFYALRTARETWAEASDARRDIDVSALVDALDGLEPDWLPPRYPIRHFKDWLPRVERFSFGC